MKVVTLNDALNHFKTKAELARALKISRQAVNAWAADAPLPELQQLKLNHEIIPALSAEPIKKAS